MKKIVIIGLIILFALGVVIFFQLHKSSPESIIKPTMIITSSEFTNNQSIPSKYTCDGNPPAGGINPPLEFSDIPENTKSFVLIVDDPDAPVGTWVHWVVFNIPQDVKEIKEHSVPSGIEGITSFGKTGYGGPCPPSGTHHYHFKVYALDTTLPLGSQADKKAILEAAQNHIVAQGELIGLYSKQ